MMFKNIKLDVDVEETYEESLSLDEINKKRM